MGSCSCTVATGHGSKRSVRNYCVVQPRLAPDGSIALPLRSFLSSLVGGGWRQPLGVSRGVVIRTYIDNDLEAVVSCFGRSVREIGARYYAPDQIAAWAPESPNMHAWANHLRGGGVFVADVDGDIAGFVRVKAGGFVDLLYVHPDYARRGVGRELLKVACSWAVARGARKLKSEVSIAARPLFEAMGFRVEREQFVRRRGVGFRNFRMARNADAEQAHASDRQHPPSPPVAGR